jgi:hypothetical protein
MRTTLCTVLLSSTLLLAAGCSEQQLASIDRAVADVNAVVTGADRTLDAVQDSPAGSLIPPQVYQIMEILGVGLVVAIALWQKIRASGLLEKNQDLVTTLRALVIGVEKAGPEAAPVKAAIKETMRDLEVYSVANPLVDQVKALPAGKIS